MTIDRFFFWPTLPSRFFRRLTNFLLPPAPTNVRASQPSQQSVTVTWNVVSSAASYTVKRRAAGVGAWTILKAGVKVMAYSDNTILKDRTYSYTVSATNAAGEGSNAAIVTLRTIKARSS